MTGDWSGARFLVGDVFDRLAEIPTASVDVIVTSPPFLALRSYLPVDHPDKAKEIGSEPTPAAFLDTLLALTVEWRRVLAPHGSLCVELGDTYSGSGGAGGDYGAGGLRDGQEKFEGSARRTRTMNPNTAWRLNDNGSVKTDGTARASEPKNAPQTVPLNGGAGWPLDKSLCGIPTLYAWSLAYGRNLLNPTLEIEPWRVRNLIAWTRPNPPVGALGDKVRPATSYVTTACTRQRRYFDLDAERTPTPDPPRVTRVGLASASKGVSGGDSGNPDKERLSHNPAGAPLLDWWEIPTQPYTGSHYATFPEELPRRLISLMCPAKVCQECGKPSERVVESVALADGQPSRGNLNGRSAVEPWREESTTHQVGRATFSRVARTLGWTDCGHNAWRPGTVLDPFAGSGTTLAVAVGMGRRAIGIDLDARNAHLAEQRVGMFLNVEVA